MSVQTKNCEFSIGDTHLVSGVSLSVTNGEVVSLIGANGAGKSSLLKLISGEYTATRGNVFLDGEIIADIYLDRRARKPSCSCLKMLNCATRRSLNILSPTSLSFGTKNRYKR